MKKKVLAFLLASTMVIEPFSVASAADFSDGMGQDTVQFSDDAEDVPEVENDDVNQFDTDAVGEGEEPTETHVQMGDNVWVDFDYSTGIATISGTGDMWDYMEDGWDSKGDNQNPFAKIRYTFIIKKIIISDGITNIGNYFLYDYADDYDVVEVLLGSSVKKIGKYAFSNCSINAIILPDGLEELGDNSFDGCALKEVTLPKSIKSIGDNCFSDCYPLKKVILPDSLTNIPYGMFSSCYNLEKIILPSKLKILSERAFSDCRNLTGVTLPSTLEMLGVEAFQNCNSLTEITLPSSLKDIEEDGFEISGAFRNCINLKKVNIEQGFSANIPGMMFENCKFLTEISIPENVSYIRFCAFSNCNRLTTIKINGAKTKISSDAFRDCKNLNTIESFDCSYARKIAEENNIHFNSLGEGTHQWLAEKEVIEEPTCTEKGIKAYRCEICGKTKDEEELPAYDHAWDNGVITKQATETEEGERTYTCRRCNETKTEKIPKLSAIKFDGVNFGWNLYDKANINGRANKAISYYITTVDKNSSAPEYDVTHDTQGSSQDGYFGIDITMPDEEVDVYIFAADTEGNHTYYKVTPNYNNRPQKPSNIVKVGDNITATVEGNQIILTGTGATYDYDEYSGWYFGRLDRIKKITIDKRINYIGKYFLAECTGIEEIEFPEGIQRLGECVLGYSTNVKKIVFPSTLEEIPQLCEGYITDIEEIVIPSGVKKIGYYAFGNVNNLKYISIPETVTEIEDNAFCNCTNLEKITIPESVKYIGSDVFKYCRNLEIHGKRDSEAERYAYVNNIKFVSGKYKVVFKNNGHTIDTYYIDKGENATPPTLSAKEGYTLSWDADYTNIQEDMVINAVWTKKDNGGGNTTIIVSPSETTKYTVTFKDRGEVVKTEKVKSGDAAEYPYISRNGYKLSWDKDFSKVTANITVNAVWSVIKPEKVTSLTAESGNKSIALSWDETEYAGYYLVYRKADSEKEYTQVAKTTKILWTDSKAVPGTQYAYKVVAVRSLSGKKYQGAESDVVTTKIGTPQIGDTYSVGELNYKLTGTKEVTVTGFAKVTDTLVIPSSVTISGKIYKVTSVQAKAFYRNKDIVNVTIGNNVTYVGKYAFYQCPNLETVKFGKRVSVISTCAFTQCPNLESVILPASVKRLGAKVFYKCNSIRVIQIESSGLEYVGKKGLAVNKTVTLKLPKKVYTRYKELIKASGVYSKTKFVKS